MREKYLIESNGQVYGPADVDQLIQWVAEGRVVAQTTLIHAESGERKLASDHAELRSWFAPTSPTPGATAFQTPPPPQGRAGDGNATGVGGYPGGYAQQQREMPRQPWSGDYQQSAPVPYRGYGYGENDSGTGAMAQLPAELQGVNFGAFFASLLWSIFNKSYLGLLVLVPAIGWVVPFILLFKGNEWAWQNRRFESVEQFRQVQQAWALWGVVFFLINGVFWLLMILGGIFSGINP